MRKIKQKAKKSIKPKRKSNILEVIFIIVSLIIISYFTYVIHAPVVIEDNGLSSLRAGLTVTDKPILILSLEMREFGINNDFCYTIIKGKVENIGNKDAIDVKISCKPPALSFAESNIMAAKKIENINAGKISSFEIKSYVTCERKEVLNCRADCMNC